ncbi:MAG: hypothetical protein AVDCRST_MAG87-2582, partial [uncultured Thermomicrobiales bacterium]
DPACVRPWLGRRGRGCPSGGRRRSAPRHGGGAGRRPVPCRPARRPGADRGARCPPKPELRSLLGDALPLDDGVMGSDHGDGRARLRAYRRSLQARPDRFCPGRAGAFRGSRRRGLPRPGRSPPGSCCGAGHRDLDDDPCHDPDRDRHDRLLASADRRARDRDDHRVRLAGPDGAFADPGRPLPAPERGRPQRRRLQRLPRDRSDDSGLGDRRIRARGLFRLHWARRRALHADPDDADDRAPGPSAWHIGREPVPIPDRGVQVHLADPVDPRSALGRHRPDRARNELRDDGPRDREGCPSPSCRGSGLAAGRGRGGSSDRHAAGRGLARDPASWPDRDPLDRRLRDRPDRVWPFRQCLALVPGNRRARARLRRVFHAQRHARPDQHRRGLPGPRRRGPDDAVGADPDRRAAGRLPGLALQRPMGGRDQRDARARLRTLPLVPDPGQVYPM